MKRKIRDFCKCFVMMFVFVMVVFVALPAVVSAQEKSQDGEYYKHLRSQETNENQKYTFSDSKIATYGAKSSTGKQVVQFGIDVSEHNGVIDWNQVKAAGVEFAFIRVAWRAYGTGGELYTDYYGIENLRKAKALGIKVGAYIYSQAITEREAESEVNKCINVLRESGVTLDLPLVMDVEYPVEYGRVTGRLYEACLSRSKQTAICKAFIARAKAKGYEPMIYSYRSMFTDKMNPADFENDCQIWVADWDLDYSLYSGAYDCWQCTENGYVPGINIYGDKKNVDIDYMYIPRIPRSSYPTGSVGITPPSDVAGNTTTVPANTDVIEGKYVTYNPMKAATGVVIGSYVNVRRGPDTAFTLLGKAYKNQTFTVNGTYRDIFGMDWYRVKINLNGTSQIAYLCQDYVCLKSELPKAPVLKQTTQSATSIKLTWTSVADAEKYKVYRYNYSTEKYVCIATVDGNITTYTDKGLITNRKQRYVVRALKYKYGNVMYGTTSNYRIGYTGGVKGYVNRAAGLAVHSGAGTKDNLYTLKNNARVNIISTSGNWHKVYYEHDNVTKLGYVNKKYIRLN